MRSIIFALSLFATSAAAVPVKGTVSFHATTNAYVDIESEAAVTGDLIKVDSYVSGTFKVKLDDFKTGQDKRDAHLRKVLETDKFPEATFVLSKVLMAAGSKKAFQGTMDLHGQKKPIKGLVTFNGSEAEAEFSVDITKFGMEQPSFTVVTVQKDVSIKVTIPL